MLLNKLNKILNSSEKKRLFSNFFYLSLLQAANYLLPLITFPYLARVLGPEKFGLIAFAQAFIQYFVILTDYGFNLSATREISIYREDKDKLEEIFSAVMIIKLVLLLVSFILLIIIVFSFEKFRKDWLVYILSFGIVVGQTLFPIWFFQGLEKMKYITFLNILAKFLFTILSFLFIKSSLDYWKVPLLNSLGIILVSLLSLYFIYLHFKIHLKIIKLQILFYYVKYSFSFFLARFSITIYTNSINLLLGFLFGYKAVAYYEISYKLLTIIRQPWDILNTVLYPYMSKTQNFSLLRKIILLSFILAILISLILYITSPYIFTLLFGSKFIEAAQYFRILLFIVPLISIHIYLGSSTLAAAGFYKQFNLSNLLATIFFIIQVSLLYLLNILTVQTLLISIVLVDLNILLVRLYYVWKLQILSQLIRGVKQ